MDVDEPDGRGRRRGRCGPKGAVDGRDAGTMMTGGSDDKKMGEKRRRCRDEDDEDVKMRRRKKTENRDERREIGRGKGTLAPEEFWLLSRDGGHVMQRTRGQAREQARGTRGLNQGQQTTNKAHTNLRMPTRLIT